ncbi:MAG TPA: glycosyltransferase family 39 protein [Terriglobia bacterium]|nr:glycosyltransferase family 39 protein [Terriglobia bacterium]
MSEPSAGRTTTDPLILGVVIAASAVYLAGLIYYAHVRPIDADEGFYTTAARLVWEGKTPYRDFFYQQAPLLPYLYSWIWAVHPRSLVAMRFLSAACGGISVLLCGLWLVSAKRLPTKVALATFALVLLNPYWASWNVVVKTFAVSNLLATVAMISLYAALRWRQARWYLVAGLALGACASVRSLYGPLIPAVLLWLLWQERQKSKVFYPKTWTFLGGAACGLLHMVVSFVRDPHAFIFNNIRYHGLVAGYLLRNGKAVVGYQSVGHTALVYFVMIVISLLGLHPYFTAELAVAIVGIVCWRKRRSRQEAPYAGDDYRYLQLALLMLLVYTATALIPFPPFDQYFDSPLVPFLVPFVAEGLGVIIQPKREWVLLLALLVPMLFFGETKVESRRLSPDLEWHPSSSRNVARAIEANSRSDDEVLSFWPGYVFESGRQYVAGMEDPFVYRIMGRISPEARARYHVVSQDQIIRAVSTRAVSLVVVGPWLGDYYENLSPAEIQEFHSAVDANYSLISKIDDVEVYRRRAGAPLAVTPAQAAVQVTPRRRGFPLARE